MSRKFDIVVHGASGFTGALVCDALNAPADLRWAMSGRSVEKLDKVKERVVRLNPKFKTLPLIICDNFDQDSVNSMASSTKVVISTAGPYLKFGTPVVEACVKHGTDYVDLTGESPWIRKMIDQFHEEAQRTGAAIVHACGFDSIPSDLGTLLVVDHIQEQYKARTKWVKAYLTSMKGAMSGGTVASAINLIESDREIKKMMFDPYLLNPRDHPGGPDKGELKTVKYDNVIGRYIHPWVMESANAKVVRRSSALKGDYGRSFSYSEVSADKGLVGAILTTLSLAFAFLLLSFTPTRNLLKKYVLPAPGQGPSKKQLLSGHFVMQLVGESEPWQNPDDKPHRVKARVQGFADPGYAETSKMLSESALCLLLDRKDTPLGEKGGGVLTPATAMGKALIQRLRAKRMKFDIVEE